ncbi:TPA: helix-turn-helix domain-containing protein [Enterococcus faecalis]
MEELIDLVKKAKLGNEEAMIKLINQFEPLLLKEATKYGKIDPDCLQELKEQFIRHVQKFEIRCNCKK